MAQYRSIPTSGTFSPYAPYTPSTTDSFSSQHPLFSPQSASTPTTADFSYPLTPASQGNFRGQKPSAQHRPNELPRRPRSWRHRFSYHVTRLWLWEALGCFVAIAVHLAMIALLEVYDDARVSSWNRPWTLNSNIALMITVIKGAALIPVASALGQLKWRRFGKYRGLNDMDIFDDASRGTLGSIRLMWHLKFWHFASFGAFLTVLALTMDTLAQNVVDTYHKLEITEGLATVPRTNNYGTFNMYTSGEEPGDQLPWPTMVTAANYGMSYTASYFWAGSDLPVICRTGNCTFGTYSSLIVDRQCRDITSYLDTSDDEVIRIPDGPYLRKSDGFLNISSTTMYPTLEIFNDIGPLILNFQAIANPYLAKPSAIQCVLFWSVSTFSTNMTNYTLYEDTTMTWTNTSQEAKTAYNQTNGIYLTPPDCWINGTYMQNSTDERCQNWVNNLAQLGLQNFLANTAIGMQGEAYKTQRGWSVSNLFTNSLYYSVGHALENETYAVMETTINNTAIMMSQGVRQLPTKSKAGNWTWAPANGTVYQWESFYNIQYYYLWVTHFIVGGSLVFLVLTIFLTRTDHPWKTSSLPLLFHGLSPKDRYGAPELPQLVDMREAAEVLKVRNAMTAEGQRLASREVIAIG